MKVILTLLLSFFVCLDTYCQKADSLEAVLQNAKADSTKTIIYSLLADELTKSEPQRALEKARQGITLAKKIAFEKGVFENYFSLAAAFRTQSLFDSAILYFRQAGNIAKHRQDIAGLADVYSSFGHCFMRKSEMDSARHYLDKGLVLSKEIKNYRVEAGIYNNYGNVFLEESNYQKALDYFVRAVRLYENPLSDFYGQCLALSNIGNIQYRLGNYDAALDYAGQSMAIAKRKKLTGQIGYAHKLFGRIYRKQQKYDDALEEYKKGHLVYLTMNDYRNVSELLQNIGNVYFDKGQHNDALKNYFQSLKHAKSIASKPLIANDYSCIGQAYLILGKNDEALLYLDSSRVAAQALGNRYLVMDNYEAMSLVYETKGNYKRALAMHRLFVQVKDSIMRSENRQLAGEIQAKYELEKKEAQISLLEKDRELKDLVMGRQQAIQVGTGIALILVVIIALLVVNRYRAINKVKRLAEIERVRNNIARDLHDDMGSTLSTINIISKLAMLENPNGNSLHLKRIAEQSSRMMETMTDIVWSINPGNDSMEKIAAKMKVFTGEILEPKNISYRFSGEETLNGMTLDAEKRKNLYMIFKETINNAAKYSGATAMEIALKQSEGKLVMVVADNGQGFVKHHVREGNGLKNMSERAKAMQAQFKLTSASGQGTRIELEMPIT